MWFYPHARGPFEAHQLPWNSESIAEAGTVTRGRKTECHRNRERRDARATEPRVLSYPLLPTSLAPAEIARVSRLQRANQRHAVARYRRHRAPCTGGL